MFYRAQFTLAKAIGQPQLRLGRRRHDNHCDECGEYCETYAFDKLDFPLEDHEIANPYATSKWEKLRAMFNAEYVRVCLECAADLEEPDQGSGGESSP